MARYQQWDGLGSMKAAGAGAVRYGKQVDMQTGVGRRAGSPGWLHCRC